MLLSFLLCKCLTSTIHDLTLVISLAESQNIVNGAELSSVRGSNAGKKDAGLGIGVVLFFFLVCFLLLSSSSFCLFFLFSSHWA